MFPRRRDPRKVYLEEQRRGRQPPQNTPQSYAMEPVVYSTPTDDDSASRMSQQELLRLQARRNHRRSRQQSRNSSKDVDYYRSSSSYYPPPSSSNHQLHFTLEERGNDDWWNETMPAVATTPTMPLSTTAPATTPPTHYHSNPNKVRFAASHSRPFDEEPTKEPSPTSVATGILKPSRHGASPRVNESHAPFYHESVPSYDSYEQRQSARELFPERIMAPPSVHVSSIVAQLGHPGEKHDYLQRRQERALTHSNLYQGEYYPDPEVQVLDDESTAASLYTSGALSEPFLFHVAAIVIQTCWRRYICTLYLEFLREDARNKGFSASSQEDESMAYPRDIASMEQKMWHLAATRIQAAFRGFWARDYLVVDHYCATRLQTQWRRHRQQQAYGALTRATLVLQTWWRRIPKEIPWVDTYGEDSVVAAIIIQTTWRAYVCEMRFLRTLVDILIVQSVARGWLVRMREYRRKKASPSRSTVVYKAKWRTAHRAVLPVAPPPRPEPVATTPPKAKPVALSTPPSTKTGASVEVDSSDPNPSSVFGIKLRRAPGPLRESMVRSPSSDDVSKELDTSFENSILAKSEVSHDYRDGLLVLVSEQSLSRRLLNEQQRVICSLKAYNIDFWTLDGADQENRGMREELFGLAKKRGAYPLYFVVTDGKPSYWGNQDAFERVNENKELAMRFPVKKGWPTTKRQNDEFDQKKLERELADRRRLQKIAALDKDPTMLDDSFEIVQRESSPLVQPPLLARKPIQSDSPLRDRPTTSPARRQASRPPQVPLQTEPSKPTTVETPILRDETESSLPSDEGRAQFAAETPGSPAAPTLAPTRDRFDSSFVLTSKTNEPAGQDAASVTFPEEDAGGNSILDSSNPSASSRYTSHDESSSDSFEPKLCETKLISVIDVTDLMSQDGHTVKDEAEPRVMTPIPEAQSSRNDDLYDFLDQSDDRTVDTKEAATAQQEKNVATLLKAFGSFDRKDAQDIERKRAEKEIPPPSSWQLKEATEGKESNQRTKNLLKLLHAMEVDQQFDDRIAQSKDGSKASASGGEESDGAPSEAETEEKKFDTLYKAVDMVVYEKEDEQEAAAVKQEQNESFSSQGTEDKAHSLLSSWNQ